MANSCKIDEFEVPVPWGHIACKTWGDETDPPILVVHGRLDNAGAFDRLIPLLPRQFYYICVDLPGHGRSSHFPSPLPIHTLDFVMVYRLILEHFKKDRLIILGHSYGGQLALLFSRLYPEKVEKLVLLDCMILYPVEVDEFKSYVLKKIEGNINLQKKLATRHQPKYSYEEAKFRLSSNRYNDESLDPEAAEGLLKRCLKQTGENKWQFL
ncbi:hypothetical protein JTB14_031845 [Gonioctena quinquepunctata]|nr:hypothetical protein JTB14_031845 [Gonioctena quinquepunctata]